ncbi:VTT domain-containing protein [Oleiagrimonas sp. C23AA]|uniref:VTT domain-containing protein n=1 Tax=Oleiagrimonas sp. C23AA TaxID=2719047 RepID=UPI00141E6DB9|nr:VTT domain-containing protein [Oleiagrimonas sp. C23AA]NII10794.1 sulfurtransferase [Oleiagrimonas sp. C23AA]
MTHEIMLALASWGLLVVFANVLIEQLGLPLPAVPTLVVCGALAGGGHLSPALVLLVALAACLLGDSAWFWAGRRYGSRVMGLLCRISLSPDSCVRTSSGRFRQRGGQVLLIAKFVPGLSTLAPPLAGASGLRWRTFLWMDGIGSLLWAGLAVALGIIFAEQIEQLIAVMREIGSIAGLLLVGLLAAYMLFKWWQRVRLLRAFRMARIDSGELRHMLDSDTPPVIVDVRNPHARVLDDRIIPGARLVDIERLHEALSDLPPDADVVLYCSCPNEVSAARAAQALHRAGFHSVHPLRGGVEAWAEAGFAVDRLPANSPAATLDTALAH